MATLIISNKKYKGSKTLPHIMDFMVDVTEKVEYLQQLYSSVDGDVNYITTDNANTLLDKLSAHRVRVTSDGGVVLSLAMTLRAIIFADKHQLVESAYSALSPDFGVKMSGTVVTKVYDLSGRDQVPYFSDTNLTINNNLNVLTSTVADTAGFMQLSPLTGAAGMVLGSCSWDTQPTSAHYVCAPRVYSDGNNSLGRPTGLGTPDLAVHNVNGSQAKVDFDSISSGFQTLTKVNKDVKYSGITAIVLANQKAELFINGVSVNSTTSVLPVDLTGKTLYSASIIKSANSFLSEHWMIASSDVELAKSLGVYLNKTQFLD